MTVPTLLLETEWLPGEIDELDEVSQLHPSLFCERIFAPVSTKGKSISEGESGLTGRKSNVAGLRENRL